MRHAILMLKGSPKNSCHAAWATRSALNSAMARSNTFRTRGWKLNGHHNKGDVSFLGTETMACREGKGCSFIHESQSWIADSSLPEALQSSIFVITEGVNAVGVPA